MVKLRQWKRQPIPSARPVDARWRVFNFAGLSATSGGYGTTTTLTTNGKCGNGSVIADGTSSGATLGPSTTSAFDVGTGDFTFVIQFRILTALGDGIEGAVAGSFASGTIGPSNHWEIYAKGSGGAHALRGRIIGNVASGSYSFLPNELITVVSKRRNGVINSICFAKSNTQKFSAADTENYYNRIGSPLYIGGLGSNYPLNCEVNVLAIIPTAETPQIEALSLNPWQIFMPQRMPLYFAETSGSVLNLSINDSSHGHSADNLALTTESFLAVADATHGHSADNLALSSGSFLTVADALHGHTSDNLTLSNEISLAVADALHGHTADSLDLSAQLTLVVADAAHGHAADSLAISSASILVVADATHGHTADVVATDVATTLSISKATHVHTADALALSVAIVLVVDDAAHGLTSDAVAIAANYILSVAKAVHAHTADVVSITISGTPTLTPEDIAAIADAVWNHPKALTLARFLALK